MYPFEERITQEALAKKAGGDQLGSFINFARVNMEPFTMKWIPEGKPYEGYYELNISDLVIKVSPLGWVLEPIKIYDENDSLEYELRSLKQIQGYIWGID